MTIERLMIVNRGEIAMRIARAAREPYQASPSSPATMRDRCKRTAALKAALKPAPRSGKKRPCVDTW